VTALRRKPGERVALVVRGRVQSRTIPRGQRLAEGPRWSIDAIPVVNAPGLRLRFDAEVVDVAVEEVMTAVHRAVHTDYDDDYGKPLVRTSATRPDGSVHDRSPEDGSWFYGNDRFTVHVRPIDDALGLEGPVRISVHDHQRTPDIPWRLLQRIKNEVVGPDRWAMQWFPDEAHLVDESNEHHLFVLTKGESPPAWLAHLGGRQVCDVDTAREVGAVQAPLPAWYPEVSS
jgi:hypothetical protein